MYIKNMEYRATFFLPLLMTLDIGCSHIKTNKSPASPASTAAKATAGEEHSAAESHHIGVIPDVEGSWAKIQAYASQSKVLRLNEGAGYLDFDPEIIGENNKIVFLGDSIDKGAENIKVLTFLMKLKNKYPERVFLIIGNRDINKLRFNWELEHDALNLRDGDLSALNKFRIFDWQAAFTKWSTASGADNKERKIDGVEAVYTHALAPNDAILKMKFMLSNTMGSPTAFEDMKAELKKIHSSDEIKDKDVYDYYRTFAAADGLIGQYLQKGQLVYWDKDTNALFVHGGVSSTSYGFIPPALGAAATAKMDALNTSEGLEAWIAALNAWAQAAVTAGFTPAGMNAAMALIQYQEPLIITNADGKPTWTAMVPNPISVIHGRPWTASFNLEPISSDVTSQLKLAGVDKVIFGHSPVGDIPLIMKDNGVLSVACDTSVTKPMRVATIDVSNTGVLVNAVLMYSAPAAASGAGGPAPAASAVPMPLVYDSWNASVGTQDASGSWVISPLDDGRLVKSKWAKSTFGNFGAAGYVIQ